MTVREIVKYNIFMFFILTKLDLNFMSLSDWYTHYRHGFEKLECERRFHVLMQVVLNSSILKEKLCPH